MAEERSRKANELLIVSLAVGARSDCEASQRGTLNSLDEEWKLKLATANAKAKAVESRLQSRLAEAEDNGKDLVEAEWKEKFAAFKTKATADEAILQQQLDEAKDTILSMEQNFERRSSRHNCRLQSKRQPSNKPSSRLSSTKLRISLLQSTLVEGKNVRSQDNCSSHRSRSPRSACRD